MVHRVAKVHVAHSPSHGAQGLDDLLVRVVVVQAPVSANHGGVVVEYHLMTTMEMIVSIKVLEQLRNLALVLDEERLEDAELGALHLPHHKPVDEVVGVEGYEQRSTIVAVGIHSAVVRDDSTLGLGEIV